MMNKQEIAIQNFQTNLQFINKKFVKYNKVGAYFVQLFVLLSEFPNLWRANILDSWQSCY